MFQRARTPSFSTEEQKLLKGNQKLFSPKEQQLLKMLLEENQEHLFSAWPQPGEDDEKKKEMMSQLVTLDNGYTEGGLKKYINNARDLLIESKEGKNPFEGFTPTVPHGVKLNFGDSDFVKYERQGIKEAAFTAFVLVAGGLGERLGYSGIKIELPCETTTGKSFMQLYAEHILALQRKSDAKKPLPLAIMTSDDTHQKTITLLENNDYFGLEKSQVSFIKQEKVGCLSDSKAHLALVAEDPFKVQTKPHGHGDVHSLLFSSGLAQKWKRQGLRWVTFFQDTNGLAFRGLIASLGASYFKDFDMNSIAVPRKAKEAIGAIAKMTNANDGSSVTINVEYNQLDPLLRDTVNPEGDVNDESGFSPFPGNINQLIIKLDSYLKTLKKTKGIIGEFVNPKYKDESRTEFKSSTRLECMMQDYPKSLPENAKVGFSTINQVWAAYSPVKNSPSDALKKAQSGNPSHSAGSAEMDMYRVTAEALRTKGATIGNPIKKTFNGIELEQWPQVVFSPTFVNDFLDLEQKVNCKGLDISSRSTLVVNGSDIEIKSLKLDGALIIEAEYGVKLTIDGLSVTNSGWSWNAIKPGQPGVPEEMKIRGFMVHQDGVTNLMYEKPGQYYL
eukprot:TRINITY_DN15979_c1_g2_i1.p1 TRINITY_DN15979_c1_g2~~TRINITY_DN15979_c1_g2_i1.p1  ORF type:complete len:615 (+),score=114.71 TRINITY_DN15979_c1_g2_i1:146-1990(+)